jgi:hypothetical protein
MSIELSPGFSFQPLPPIEDETVRSLAAASPLGPLAPLAGKWTGQGFNVIWRPNHHLLPPHPKDEHPLVDDAHFLRRGEHSAGPLLGRRLAGPGPRFEVRMSAAFARYADFVRADKVRLDQQAGPVVARRDTLASTREGVSPWTRTWPAR